MTDGRAEILARIGPSSPNKFLRSPVAFSTRSRHEIVEQFAEYAAEYRAYVIRVDESGLARAIGERLSGQVVVAADLPASWLSPSVEAVRDNGLSHRELDAIPDVLTGCRLAIAETGTIVLDAGRYQGRRAITLIPDHHVCVVFEDQVVDSVPEAVQMVTDAVRDGRPLTWISGPSATSDIELDRVEGVHGPRKLDILIVRSLGRE